MPRRAVVAVASVPKPAAQPQLPLARAGIWVAVIALTAALTAAGIIGYQWKFGPRATSGTLSVQTTPSGLQVLVGGKSVGQTPLTLPLAAGSYDLEVGAPGQRRAIKATVLAGMTSTQHIEFATVAAPPVLPGGTLRIESVPSRLPVQVDGVDRGVSPLTLDGINPGDHAVSVTTARGLVRNVVKVRQGETLSLVLTASAPASDAAATGGWLTIASPITMQIREGGKVIGSTESDRLMLPAGEHQLEIVNEALGFRATRKVRIEPGKTAMTRIELPNGSLSLNAQPWAEVWIDGVRVGDTPIGNLQRPIGPHKVVFRHPDLGERTESVVVTLRETVRLGVDLRRK